jgi:oligopeptide transport system substrate-binding protein
MMKSRLMTVFLLGCFLALCIGCSPSSQKPKASHDLRIVLKSEPLSLDPRVGGTVTSQLVLFQLFEGLTRYSSTGGPEPAIAESIDISDDCLTYIFHLRPSKWSNGEELTARDFEYAWKTVLTNPLAAQNADSFFAIRNAQKAFKHECSIDDVGIRTLNARTLQVTLEHPTPYFLVWTANPLYAPIYRPAAEKVPNWTREVFPAYVSNGPYILTEHHQNSHMVLEKNPLYWNTKESAKIERVLFSIIEDPVTTYNLFKAGDIDWYGGPFSRSVPSEVIARLEKEGQLHSQLSTMTLRMDCCVSKPHLASAKIRRAFAYAINRKDIVSYLQIGGDQPATSLVTQTLSVVRKPQFEDGNVQMARKLFDEGCAELGISKSDYPSLVLIALPHRKALAEVIAGQLHSALGIDVRAEGYEVQRFRQKIASLDADLALNGFLNSVSDQTYDLALFKYKDTHQTLTDWESTDYIKLLNAIDTCTKANEREVLLIQAETYLLEHMPAVPIIYEADKYAKNPKIVFEKFLPIGLPDLKQFEKVA